MVVVEWLVLVDERSWVQNLGSARTKNYFLKNLNLFTAVKNRRFWSTFNDGNLPFYDSCTFSDTHINCGNETAVNTAVNGFNDGFTAFNGGKKPPLKPKFGVVFVSRSTTS